jgi:hypothetical protein
MTHLALATAAFLATHFVSSTPLRSKLIGALGERPYLGLYSLVATVTFVWMIIAFAGAPREPLWTGWRLLPVFLMPIAFLLIACAFARNPTAVGAEKLLKSDEPARGMIRVTPSADVGPDPVLRLARLGRRLAARAHILRRLSRPRRARQPFDGCAQEGES